MISNKVRNKLIKSVNGNGVGNMVKILHWNTGSKFWKRKRETLEDLMLERDPDLLFVSEANMMQDLSEEQRHIGGYKTVLPNTMNVLGYARIVLLIKEDIDFKLLNQCMLQGTSSIWISLGMRGRKPLTIGGMYREQTLLRQGPDNNTDSPNMQLARWNRQLDGWKAAAAVNPCCVVVGDLNLDYNKWNLPSMNVARMVARTKVGN